MPDSPGSAGCAEEVAKAAGQDERGHGDVELVGEHLVAHHRLASFR
jgi:hypothetical protein